MLVKGQPGLHGKIPFQRKEKEEPILEHIGEDSMCIAHRKGTINIRHYFLCFVRFN